MKLPKLKPHEIIVLVMIALLLVFMHSPANAVEEHGNTLILSKDDMAKLQKFIATQQSQLADANKQIAHMADELESIKACVMTRARQGMATTTCFQDCDDMGNNCHPSTVEF